MNSGLRKHKLDPTSDTPTKRRRSDLTSGEMSDTASSSSRTAVNSNANGSSNSPERLASSATSMSLDSEDNSTDSDSDISSSGSGSEDGISEDESSDDDDSSSASDTNEINSRNLYHLFQRDHQVPPPEQPQSPKTASTLVDVDLKSRIAAFLPQLKQANETLRADQRIDDVADDEDHYIEMDLGLGVLKEKRRSATNSGEIQTRESGDSSSDEDGSSDEQDGPTTEGDVLHKLMGAKAGTKARPLIQDVDMS